MAEQIINIAKKKSPVLLDKALQEIQAILLSKLKWLNYAFGRSYRLVEHTINGNDFVYPAVYNNAGEYLSVLPNDTLGNFSWFDIYDPQDIENTVLSKAKITITGAIIFWYTLDSIYDDASVLHTEEVKNEILSVLGTPGYLSSGSHIELTGISERFENIYKGYLMQSGEIPSLDKQYFMYPFAGLRVEFKLTIQKIC